MLIPLLGLVGMVTLSRALQCLLAWCNLVLTPV